MATRQTASLFRTTNWTLVYRARASSADLEELLRLYWSPVYAYLRRRGTTPADAEDLTQDFLTKVVLQRDMLGRADNTLGRFRVFLMQALKNFLIDWHRHKTAARRGPTTVFLPSDPSKIRLAEPNDADHPAGSFDKQWAAAVFQAALDRTRDDCRRDGMDRHWRAFDARVLRPKLHGAEPIPVQALRTELAVGTAQEIHDMTQTVKRRFRRVFEEVVAETVEDAAEIDDEIREVRRHLAAV